MKSYCKCKKKTTVIENDSSKMLEVRFIFSAKSKRRVVLWVLFYKVVFFTLDKSFKEKKNYWKMRDLIRKAYG